MAVLAIPTIIQVPTVSCTQRTHISGLGSLQVQENGMPSALVTLISESVPTASILFACGVQRIMRTKGRAPEGRAPVGRRWAQVNIPAPSGADRSGVRKAFDLPYDTVWVVSDFSSVLTSAWS